MSKIIKMKDLLKRNGIELGKVYTDKNKPPFKITEATLKIGSGKFANIYKMKEDMKDGDFDPKNPQVHIHGLGVYYLKTLEKVITRDLSSRADDLGGELAAKNLNTLLFSRYATLGSKIKGLHEVYQQMNSSVYKRAVTIYKRKK